jgi:hypothetical protein
VWVECWLSGSLVGKVENGLRIEIRIELELVFKYLQIPSMGID